MKFLADAHIGGLICRLIESHGHDVLKATSLPPKTSDSELLRIAATDNRIVITSDKDFGELVFRAGNAAAGIILLRIDVRQETERAAVIQYFWPQIELAALGHFVMVTAKTIRRTPLP